MAPKIAGQLGMTKAKRREMRINSGVSRKHSKARQRGSYRNEFSKAAGQPPFDQNKLGFIAIPASALEKKEQRAPGAKKK